MQEKIQNLVLRSLENLDLEDLKSPNLQTKIYGIEGCLDSLALLRLVLDLEVLLSEEFNKDVILADERMMSLKNSPFKDVKSLSLYIESILRA